MQHFFIDFNICSSEVFDVWSIQCDVWFLQTPSELAAPDTEPQRILEEAASAVPSQ